MKWISPEECQQLIGRSSIELIDVRENWEYEICHIASTHIPMHEITAVAVANLLESEHGFTDISVLEGGITAWYALTDPTFEIY
jgi:rhodanese-related sulfurtransferase